MSRSHHKGGEASQRMLRVAELIRHAAAELLSRGVVEDDVLATHVVTVPSVKMSPDLKLATIYVMPLGGKDVDAVLKALERHKKFMRGEIAHRIHMKYAPELRFRIDESFDNAAKIDALLASPKVVRDLDHGDEAAREDETGDRTGGGA